ncbi:MAG: AI-2E family transporter [Actinobacteria bacterium]|nr:AI-2E family transporter [Actinomycetota bacterium]
MCGDNEVTVVESPIKALFVLGFIVVYQQIENFLIAPKITAQTMELHAGVAFASAIVGGAVLGPTGAILGLAVAWSTATRCNGCGWSTRTRPSSVRCRCLVVVVCRHRVNMR